MKFDRVLMYNSYRNTLPNLSEACRFISSEQPCLELKWFFSKVMVENSSLLTRLRRIILEFSFLFFYCFLCFFLSFFFLFDEVGIERLSLRE